MALVDRIIGVESGGNPYARNPRSSAAGPGQFIDSTWLSMIQKYRPDLAGMDRATLLSMKSDPALSREMTQAYADENASGLKAAGFDANPGNTYLAHFAGLGGAKTVLGADPSTPVAGLLDASAVAANPFLKNMTAGDLVNWAAGKVGSSDGAAAPLPAPVNVASLPVAGSGPSGTPPAGLLAPTPDQTQDPAADPYAQMMKGLLAPSQPAASQPKQQDPLGLLADDGLLAQRPRQFQPAQPMGRTKRFA